MKEIDDEIRAFERRYEITSKQMLAELNEGTRKETADIASWLIALHIRNRVDSTASY
jgi:hypothetical protein